MAKQTRTRLCIKRQKNGQSFFFLARFVCMHCAWARASARACVWNMVNGVVCWNITWRVEHTFQYLTFKFMWKHMGAVRRGSHAVTHFWKGVNTGGGAYNRDRKWANGGCRRAEWRIYCGWRCNSAFRQRLNTEIYGPKTPPTSPLSPLQPPPLPSPPPPAVPQKIPREIINTKFNTWKKFSLQNMCTRWTSFARNGYIAPPSFRICPSILLCASYYELNGKWFSVYKLLFSHVEPLRTWQIMYLALIWAMRKIWKDFIWDPSNALRC